MAEEVWTSALIALGSNIEPRRKYLQSAVRALSEHPRVLVARRSRLFESQSVEGGGPGDFLNAAIEIQTSLSAHELLALCQSIEAAAGRHMPAAGEHRHGARTLDLDILSLGDGNLCSPELLLPHPRALWRSFVLLPVLDLLQQSDGSGGWIRPLEWDWEEE